MAMVSLRRSNKYAILPRATLLLWALCVHVLGAVNEPRPMERMFLWEMSVPLVGPAAFAGTREDGTVIISEPERLMAHNPGWQRAKPTNLPPHGNTAILLSDGGFLWRTANQLIKTDAQGFPEWTNFLASADVMIVRESAHGFIIAVTRTTDRRLAAVLRLDGSRVLETTNVLSTLALSADERPDGTRLLSTIPEGNWSAKLETYNASGALLSSQTFPAIYSFHSPGGISLVRLDGFTRLDHDLNVVATASFPPIGYRAAVDAAYMEPTGALVYIYGTQAHRFTVEGELQTFSPSLNDFRTFGGSTFGSGAVGEDRAWIISENSVKLIRRVEAEKGTPYFFRENAFAWFSPVGGGFATNYPALISPFTSEAPMKVAIKTSLHNTGLSTAAIFYTLDGSEPTTNSTRYTAPFVVKQSAEVRAGVFHSSLAAPLQNQLSVRVTHPFKVTAAPWAEVRILPEGGGGPASSIYAASNQIVRIEASGTSPFLRWLGDAHGTNRVLDLLVDSDKHVQGLLGVPILVGATSSGVVYIDAEGPAHPFLPTRLHPVPHEGFRFAGWSGLESISNNILPRAFNSPVTPLFEPLTEGSVALSAGAFGPGDVLVSPMKDFYERGEVILLEAKPRPGSGLLGWSDGEKSPLRALALNSSLNVMACFAGPAPGGFGFALFKPPGKWEIRAIDRSGASASLGFVTNSQPILHFVDAYSTTRGARIYHVIESR